MKFFEQLFLVVVVLVTLGNVRGDFCFDGDYTWDCDWGCCGTIGDQYCCGGYGWSTGGIAGASIGFFALVVITVVAVICCRRRRIYGSYWGRPAVATMTVVNPNTTVSTVSSSNMTQYPSQPPPYYSAY